MRVVEPIELDTKPLCPARAFHVGRGEEVEMHPDGHWVCTCGCEFEYENAFYWRVLKQNSGQALVDSVTELVQSRADVISVCREVLASLSLEGNFEHKVGSPELQGWVGIWTKRFKEAIGES